MLLFGEKGTIMDGIGERKQRNPYMRPGWDFREFISRSLSALRRLSASLSTRRFFRVWVKFHRGQSSYAASHSFSGSHSRHFFRMARAGAESLPFSASDFSHAEGMQRAGFGGAVSYLRGGGKTAGQTFHADEPQRGGYVDMVFFLEKLR